MKKLNFTLNISVFLAVFAAVLLPALAMAAGGIDLPDTQIANKSDLSSNLIGKIIGEPWADLGGNVLSAGISSVLLPILNALNSGALLFVTVYSVYIFAIGSVTIAYTGNWNDSQVFSTFWSPIRSTAAIALCAPLPSGLSVLQNMILVALSMSINLANNVSDKFMEHVNEVGGISLTSSVSPKAEEDFGKIFGAISNGLGIQAAALGIYGLEIQGEKTFIVNKTNDKGKHIITLQMAPPKRAAYADMPSIIIESPNENIAVGIYNGVVNMYSVAQQPYHKFLSSRVEERGKTSDLKGVVSAMHKAYSVDVLTGYKAALQNMTGADGFSRDIIKNMSEQSKVYGWVTTGLYPFAIARAQGEALDSLKSTVTVMNGADPASTIKKIMTVTTVEITALKELFTVIEDEISATRAAGAYAGMQNVGNQRPGQDGDSFLSVFWDKLAEIIDKKMPEMLVTKLKESNPLAVLFEFGNILIGIGAGGLTLLAGVSGAIEASSWTSKAIATGAQLLGVVGAPFSGGASLPAAGAITAASGFAGGMVTVWTPILSAGMAVVMAFGLACCYLLPLIPVIYWSRALISWIVLVLETLIAGPFWAAAHVFPEGVGLAGSHARRGYLMLMDVFMRPVLLVCGAIISMLLLQAVGTFMSEILGIWAVSTNQAAGYWIVGVCVTTGSMIYLMYYTTKWLFLQAIGVFPEKVIKWLGGESMESGRQDAQGIAAALGGGVTASTGRAAGGLGKAAIGKTEGATAAVKSSLNKGK